MNRYASLLAACSTPLDSTVIFAEDDQKVKLKGGEIGRIIYIGGPLVINSGFTITKQMLLKIAMAMSDNGRLVIGGCTHPFNVEDLVLYFEK